MSQSKDPYFNLGTYTRPITTSSPEAQIWFDRGLLWTYAFNHEEAVRCFERANLHDPHCIMALWGLAFALGPNYNKPWEAFGPDEREDHLRRARVALTAAEVSMELVKCTDVEKGLVRALRCRYPATAPDQGGEENHEGWNRAYADAMSHLHQTSPKPDLDITALYVDALMNLTPWGLWDMHTNTPAPGAQTLLAQSLLEHALSTAPGRAHPGLLHLYIHLMEMSPSPESALPLADHLRGLVPDAGHLEHMPTHLDVLCGDWERAMASNTSAIAADAKYAEVAGPRNFYSLYRAHNLHFKIYAAMFAGRYRVAVETAGLVEETLPEEALRVEDPPMADWLESFVGLRVHVYVRFGKWEEMLRMEFPGDQELYCVTVALMRYGRGVALSVLGRVEEAKVEVGEFHAARERVPESRTLFNNTARDILAVGAAMLEGEYAYRAGDVKAGLEHLRQAVDLSDRLPYDEPWGWMQPPRHAYGALLLEQGRVEEARDVYAADLGISDALPRALRHPKNVWALHGYCECVKKLGGQEQDWERELEEMIEKTDVPVRASCFCRREED